LKLDDYSELKGFFSKLVEIFTSEAVKVRLEILNMFLSEESYKNCPEYRDFFNNYSFNDVNDLVNERDDKCDLLTFKSVSLLKGYIEKVYAELEPIVSADRLETLNECLDVYRIGAYKACALLLLSQIEGIMMQCIKYKEAVNTGLETANKNKLSGIHDKKEALYKLDGSMYDPFPVFKRVFNTLITLERNTMSHDGILVDAKLKSFFFFVILLSVAGNVRYIIKKEIDDN